MALYLSIKIREDKVENLKKALQSKGLSPRSNAEAINILIHDFLMKNPINTIPKDNNQEIIPGESI